MGAPLEGSPELPNSHGDPVIYLIGSAGHPNFGDEFVTAAWLTHLARTMPNAEVWLDTPRPGPSAALHGDLHPNVQFSDTIFQIAWNAPSEKPADVAAFAADVLESAELVPRDMTGIADLKDVDVVHVLGGSYLSANWPRHAGLLATAVTMGELFGARTAISGTTLVPFSEDSGGVILDLLAKFDLVDVRDSATRSLVEPAVAHLTMTGDDALLHPNLTSQDRVNPALSLVCVQSDFLTVALADVADYVVRTLKEWGSEEVLVVECLPPDDSAIRAFLEPHFAKVDLVPFSHIWRYGFPSSPRSRWLTTRYHAHLLGEANGGWGVVLPVGGDHTMGSPQDLIDAGSSWVVAPDLEHIVPWSRHIRPPFGGHLSQLIAAKTEVADRVSALVAGA